MLLMSSATAQECVNATFSPQVWLCPEAKARQTTVAKLAVPLATGASDIDATAYYKNLVFDWSRSIKLTPLFFPGPPPSMQGFAIPAPKKPTKQEKRAWLLKNDYLFSHDRKEALGWHKKLRLSDLFDEPRLILARGDDRYVLTKKGKEYVHETGEYAGSKAKLLLFDRVTVDTVPFGPPSAFDLDAVRMAVGIRRMDIVRFDTRTVEVKAHLADGTVVLGTVFHDGKKTGMAVDVGGAEVAELESRCVQNRRVMDMERLVLRQTAIMEAEHLRFDEPYREVGQQDGALRRAWLKAYRQHKSKFEFNNVSYDVYDTQGRPNVPQVCVDFLVDAYDRASGTWFQPKGQPPERTVGWLNVREVMDNVDLRMVRNLVRTAQAKPDMWEVYDVPKENRIPFKRRTEFYDHLYKFPKTLHEADIFVIWGLRSDNRNHYHSMFIYRTDPVYGQPVLFSDQAGYVRVRVLDEIMRAAPRRYILHWLRLRPEWLVAKAQQVGQ